MRATISSKDKPKLSSDQQEQLRRVLRGLRRVQIDKTSSGQILSIHRCFLDGKELRVEMVEDGKFPPKAKGLGVKVYLDGDQIEHMSVPSVSRGLARAIIAGKLTPRLCMGKITQATWTRVPVKGGAEVSDPNVDPGEIIVEKDFVSIMGIRLPRCAEPGPMTPTDKEVVRPRDLDDELKTVAAAIATNRPILLTGDTGTGKTTLVTYLAHLCQVNLLHVSGDPEYAPSLWLGHLHAKQGQTYWVDGDLPTAMKGLEGNGRTWLFVDELSRMLPDNTAPLIPAIERRGGTLGKIRLTDNPDPQQRIVRAHADFRCICAMNPFDGDFVGTQEVDLALLRRLSIKVELDYPNLSTTYELLKEKHHNLPTSILDRLAKIAKKLRDERKSRRIQLPCSPDLLDAWAAMIPALGWEQATRVCITNAATVEDRPHVSKIISTTT